MSLMASTTDIEKAWEMVFHLEKQMNEPGAFLLVLPRPGRVEIRTAPNHALPSKELYKVKEMIRAYLRSKRSEATQGPVQ